LVYFLFSFPLGDSHRIFTAGTSFLMRKTIGLYYRYGLPHLVDHHHRVATV
jgi:hypothetical protein